MKKGLVESVLMKDREKIMALKGQLLNSMASATYQFAKEDMEQAKKNLDDVELIMQRMENMAEEKLVHDRADRKLQSDIQEAVRTYAKTTGNENIYGFEINLAIGRGKK
ncbi:hypothetical protein [Alkalicoccobacillus plakortidis]|uniref:Uncharacterized protein n=1 Tax=Alkalicoccobacillus plakortidis TaxID=444060 RepID=A0ABT0XFB8_9BACI|nr:hypothetical protein [Alkalicoccobacillus plakortidis]MCM2674053.1 hypothetical protein [Alkalicoccobacillus plakortidis]MCM2677734.1 hypothetical protein [Alkalicoccobacillus plakortidis]